MRKPGAAMREWNVVVNIKERGLRRAFETLKALGPVGRSGYFNVLLVKAANIPEMLEGLLSRLADDPDALSFVSRLIPVTVTFLFHSPEDFREKAKEAALNWAPELAGRSFHVRMHRRGFKGRLSSLEEEQSLAQALLSEIQKSGNPARITFTDPDCIIAVETVSERAGLSIWSREDLKRYPFVRIE